MEEDWVVVFVAVNRPVADMVIDFLGNEGIRAMSRSPGLPPFIGVDMAVEILVSPEQEDEAREAINAFLEGAPEGWPEEGGEGDADRDPGKKGRNPTHE